MTSRILKWSVSSITSLSRPMPMPPVGGMPYSRAIMKSSSTAICTCQSIVVANSTKDKISNTKRHQKLEGWHAQANQQRCMPANSTVQVLQTQSSVSPAMTLTQYKLKQSIVMDIRSVQMHAVLVNQSHMPLSSEPCKRHCINTYTMTNTVPGTQHAAQGQHVHLSSNLTDVAINYSIQILQLTSCGVSSGCSDWLPLVSD